MTDTTFSRSLSVHLTVNIWVYLGICSICQKICKKFTPKKDKVFVLRCIYNWSMCNCLKDACLGVQVGRHKIGWMKDSSRDTETTARGICSSTCKPNHGDYTFHFVKKWGCRFVNWTSICGVTGFLAWEILKSHFTIKSTVNFQYIALKYETSVLLNILN